ncbi:porin [Zooshikella ganghwensis]|uniref:Porin n=1 Tax=Zooshikella ganghwensis TaxID=202772 RepID=A0A4P9VLT4_9GAMM|nr:porin [Zooshikella ganghwensis]RDH43806.1 porin [Zooshikella ganghwensis]
MKQILCYSCSTLLLCSGSLFAIDRVDIGGFGTVTGVSTFNDKRPYRGFRDDDVDFEQESLFGLQVRADLKDGLSGTAQIVARGFEDWDAEFEWGYLTYIINSDWTFKGGRFRTPFFQYSDVVDVGYAYHWVRPPVSVYAPLFKNLDGVTVTHTADVWDLMSSVNLFYGKVNKRINFGGSETSVDLKHLWGGSWGLSGDWYTLRFSYFQAEASFPFTAAPALTAILAQPAPPPGAPPAPPGPSTTLTTETSKATEINADDAFFASISLRVDYDDFFAVAEVTKSDVDDSYFTNPLAYYISVGYTIGDFTPHLTYEQFDTDAQYGILDKEPPGTPRDTLEGIIQQTEEDFKQYTVGVRYDFHRSAALKFDFNYIDYKVEDGVFRVDAPLYSISANFVF